MAGTLGADDIDYRIVVDSLRLEPIDPGIAPTCLDTGFDCVVVEIRCP